MKTNNKQQTAVEWLEWVTDIELKSLEKGIINLTAFKLNLYFNINKAKEMEKQRIIKAWKAGDGKYDKVADKLAEKYYNETFGGGKQ